ncbi:MAG TPA: hypothetical protein DD624_01495 [Alphaproteobacteria bacterium]|nr:hypothetical protein [Alphaproteobacteria bacterium]
MKSCKRENMSAIVNETLSIKFPQDKFADFYLYDLTLTEGISDICRAEAVVLSDKPHSLEQLNEALDANVTVTVSQRLSDGKAKRTRFFHGIVTAVSHNGVFYSSDKTDCFSYRLTIESELAVLRQVVRKVAYNNKTPIDVISELLSDYGIPPRFSEEYISRKPFVSDCIYNQTTVSDYAFLKRLLTLYGLSYTVKHPKVSNGGLGRAELYFSAGEHYPERSDVVYSDGRAPMAIEEFDFRSSDEPRNLWRLNEWAMTRGQGVDGVMLTETYPNSNVGSEKWKAGLTDAGNRRRIYTEHFHNYVRGVDKAKVDADVDLILQAQYRAFQIIKDVWTGTADNLLFMPCKRFRIKHFYGRRDSSAISGMVVKSVLHCHAKLPSSLAAVADWQADKEIVEVSFSAMNCADETRYCSLGE